MIEYAMTIGGRRVAAAGTFEVDDPARAYVSRAALKLVAGFEHFGFDLAGAVALDIGASTGGFTQVLLERGAAKVFAACPFPSIGKLGDTSNVPMDCSKPSAATPHG